MPEPEHEARSRSAARFRIGDLVETALYGRAEVEFYYFDKNLDWTYSLRIERNVARVQLVEAALTETSAVVRLAELVL